MGTSTSMRATGLNPGLDRGRRAFTAGALSFSASALNFSASTLRVSALWIALGCAAPARGTIGAVLLRKPDGRVYIRDVPAHLAAAQAGIKAGDELLLIEGQDVRRLADEDLRRVLSGHVGQPVKLTLARGDEVVRVTVNRSMAEPYRLE